MEILRAVSVVFVVIGWLVFCYCIGAATAISAGTVAGVIAGLLALFFTGAVCFFWNNGLDNVTGCSSIVVVLVWLVASIFAISVLLATTMAVAWANTLAVLIVIAWLVTIYIYHLTSS